MKDKILIRKAVSENHLHEWICHVLGKGFLRKDGTVGKQIEFFPFSKAAVLAKHIYLHNLSKNKVEQPKEDLIRSFDSGATRDTAEGKLDYVKALSPLVLRRYVQYLDKHRKQSDGSYRDFDNWKRGMNQEVYHSSGGRHFFDTWLLTEGYVPEDNHGPVDLENALCAQLFNLMGRLHEILKTDVDRTPQSKGDTE